MGGFTRVPNLVIDQSELNPYQFQLLTIIIRKTDGWCKVEDGISLSQFEKLVTFKKPKIISTLKELSEMNLIDKSKHLKEDGGNSYNSYKISTTLVTENNKGSNSELQGVVTEDYKQKKTNTKETNTKREPSLSLPKSFNSFTYPQGFENLWSSYKQGTKSEAYKAYIKIAEIRYNQIVMKNEFIKPIIEILKAENNKTEYKRHLSTILRLDIIEEFNNLSIIKKESNDIDFWGSN